MAGFIDLSGFGSEAYGKHAGSSAPQQVHGQHRAADRQDWSIPRAQAYLAGAVLGRYKWHNLLPTAIRQAASELEKGKSTLKASDSMTSSDCWTS